jgi:hypothetical protein
MMGLQLVDTETGELPEPSAAFSDFWLLYPRHVGKLAAVKAWARITEANKMAAIIGAAEWRPIFVKRMEDGEDTYVPHPSTWLNGERWEDELPPCYRPTSASHQPAALPEQGSRTVMPDKVRALLAKLRGKA